jgi:hypothetical protein
MQIYTLGMDSEIVILNEVKNLYNIEMFRYAQHDKVIGL